LAWIWNPTVKVESSPLDTSDSFLHKLSTLNIKQLQDVLTEGEATVLD